ncbi:DUF374 domain-containing protein [Phragmitibacter flavus]|uniref:DUF374 domain-containing protein n=1 Tax=Phragmitibacter flavus TaxID=2576071 RepID=A0A5R8K879_9BACT|nr:lysophospholipid acyltransferase family protein [Phragmitibacter flavus]TLD68548.1 DUF374 domain-containing protein [Phragmitibacter flavus]
MAKIRLKNPGRAIAALMRGIGNTLDCHLHNTANVDPASSERYIWAFWHDSMFLMPWMWEAIFPARPAVILTSPSGDGEVIAQTCAEFRLLAARGSSSRRGAQAMIELAKLARSGHDLGVTPDGPRGPRHHLNPGIIKLAQLTGLRIIPLHVTYQNAFKFNTWDGFQLPVPFSRVDIEFRDPITIPRDATESQCEELRQHVQQQL